MTLKPHIRKSLHNLLLTLVALCIVLCLASWVTGFYIDRVNGVFSTRGIRWIVSNAMPNFDSVPLGKIICALLAAGVIRESGVLTAFGSHTSLKQRYALRITITSVIILIATMASVVLMPGSSMLSAFGSVDHSPLQKGWYGIMWLLMLLIGNVYGFTSGRLVGMNDFVKAHVSIFASVAPYFITLFVASQFVAILDYSDLLALTGHEAAILGVIRPVLYYCPLLLYIILAL